MSVNKAIILGRLGRDPELKNIGEEMCVCNFSLATSEKRKQGAEWVEQTEWHNIVTFGKLAENCGKYLAKGSECFVEGRIQTRKYNGKDGAEKTRTEIIAQAVQFVGSRREAGQAGGAPEPAQQVAAQRVQSFSDEEIPF